MTSPMDMMRIQAQIRQNATEMADYFKDLNDWEKEICQKDKAIKDGKIRAKPNSSGVRPPGFAEMIPSGVPGVKEKLMEQKAAAVKPKNYTQYRDWDKVDVDAIVADMDRQEDLEKEAAARARLAKERALREADEAAASIRIEQAIALKEEGNSRLKQGDLQGALHQYSAAIALHPNDAVFFCNRAEVHLRMQSFDAAEQDCNSALKIDKRMTKALFRRGKARIALSNRTGAIEDFKKVLSFDPGNALAQRELVNLDGSAAKRDTFTLPAADAVSFSSAATISAKSATSAAAPTSSSVLHHPTLTSSAHPPRKEPPAKMTAFKPGFLNSEPIAPKPRRIQIQEDSDESDPDAVSDNYPASVTTQALTSDAANNMIPPMKPSHAAAAAAAAAAVAVSDEDIVARAARIASMNSEGPSPVPRNWHEFEKTWKTLRRNQERFDSYILALPLHNWTAIFGSMMTGEALADILDATARLVLAGISTPSDTLKRLQLLAALPRFKMLIMFLDAPSIACLHSCIASAGSVAELADIQASLRQQWGID